MNQNETKSLKQPHNKASTVGLPAKIRLYNVEERCRHLEATNYQLQLALISTAATIEAVVDKVKEIEAVIILQNPEDPNNNSIPLEEMIEVYVKAKFDKMSEKQTEVVIEDTDDKETKDIVESSKKLEKPKDE